MGDNDDNSSSKDGSQKAMRTAIDELSKAVGALPCIRKKSKDDVTNPFKISCNFNNNNDEATDLNNCNSAVVNKIIDQKHLPMFDEISKFYPASFNEPVNSNDTISGTSGEQSGFCNDHTYAEIYSSKFHDETSRSIPGPSCSNTNSPVSSTESLHGNVSDIYPGCSSGIFPGSSSDTNAGQLSDNIGGPSPENHSNSYSETSSYMSTENYTSSVAVYPSTSSGNYGSFTRYDPCGLMYEPGPSSSTTTITTAEETRFYNKSKSYEVLFDYDLTSHLKRKFEELDEVEDERRRLSVLKKLRTNREKYISSDSSDCD